ncbi:MAG: hypothetical protein ACO1OC_11905 [Tuberibacillus sp.]
MKTVSQVLKKSGHDIYENMLTVIGLSLCWFALLIPAFFFLVLPVAVIYLVLTAIPGLAGVIYAMKHKINRKPFKYSLFLKGIAKFYGRSLVFSFIYFLFALILVSSWWYCVHNSGFLPLIIAIFQTYFFAFVMLALYYALPIMVVKDAKVSDSIKASLSLFLRKSGYTMGTGVQILTVGLLLLVTVVSIPLLFAGMLSVFIINTYENLCPEEEKDPSYHLSHMTS